ncbi:MAG: peptide/nickel transport system substrate-binding protein [Natronomonas sp.]|jgi:peptide/nickel transport system substrate-binding protein
MLGVGVAAGVAGCSGNSTDTPGNESESGGGVRGLDEVDGEPTVSGSYDTVTSASFTTLNPLYNDESSAGTAIGRALDLGYTFDADGEYVPRLYDMSTDDSGSVWVFDIHDGLEFSDPYGTVGADSFVYQIEALHQSDWANTASSSQWNGVNVEATGDLQFQAELPEPQLLWPESFDPLEYPIPRGLVEPYVDEEDVDGLQQDTELLELSFAGNLGAFVLDEWNRGSGTEYSRNDDYYVQDIEESPAIFSNAPYFEGASISVIEEQSSRLGALETGEADAASVPPERFDEFDSKEAVSMRRIPQPFNRILSVNMRDNGWNAGPGNLFRYIEFRQAIATAIGKDDLIEGIYRGLAKPHYTWQPEWSQWYPGNDGIPFFGTGERYGSEPARELASAAFERSEFDYRFDGDRLVTPEDDQVTLDVYHSVGQETSQLIAEYVAGELDANLGIDVVVEAIDGVRFDEDYWGAEPQGGTDTVNGESVTWERPTPTNPGPRSVTSNESWDMSLVFGLNTFPRNPLTNETFFDGANSFYNPVGYYPEFDARGLFDQARSATTESELADAMAEVFVNLGEEQPYVMLTFGESLNGYNPDLRGPIENFSNGWDFPGWHFSE